MDKVTLENVLTAYLSEHPETTDIDLLQIIKNARKNAYISGIQAYEPLRVIDKRKITTEFEEQHQELTRKHYEDEATTTEEFY